MGNLAFRASKEILGSASKRALIRPPIWPFSGNPAIASRLAADWDILWELDLKRVDEELVWHVLCDLEDVVHCSIAWELATERGLLHNPFFAVVECYASGWFPLGVDFDDRHEFLVFGFESLIRKPPGMGARVAASA